MSMKRSKQRSSGSSRHDDEPSFFSKRGEAEPEKSWDADVGSHADGDFQPYSLKSHFEKGALVMHPKFGKGMVVALQGGTVDVLFQDGKKKLGHAAT